MKKLHLSKQFFIRAGVLLAAISVLTTGAVLAKYADTRKNEIFPATAKSFYFESNYLTADNHRYKLNANTESVSIALYNYENELRISEMDCTYTVTVTSDDTDFLLDGVRTSEASFAVDQNEKSTVTVTLGQMKNGFDYQVTVTANGGYQKTLSSIFSVACEQNCFFMNADHSNASFVVLTVWTENISGTVTVNVPAGLIPDTTDPVLQGVINYNDAGYGGFTFTDEQSFSDTYASRSYRFFKAQNYDAEQAFTVTMDELPATETSIS